MTNKEYIAMTAPKRLSKTAIGGVIGCPEDYGLVSSLRNGKENCKNDCEKCWQLECRTILSQ